MVELIVIIGLILLMICQQIYFLWQIQKLVDKFMSGSYQGYVAAQKELRTEQKIVVAPPNNVIDDLAILNGMVGR